MGWFCKSCKKGPWGANDKHCQECGVQKRHAKSQTQDAQTMQSSPATENNDEWYCPRCHDGPYGSIQDECQAHGCYGKKPSRCGLDDMGHSKSLTSMADTDMAVVPRPSSPKYLESYITSEPGELLRYNYRTPMRFRGKSMLARMALWSGVEDV